ncbi:hypothetical protein [Staphylococcus xylosus]|uniref:hypothetical protein n=1 Tax=Staphylococcus xylosus TaxID=1288 RepID=UPI00403EB782
MDNKKESEKRFKAFKFNKMTEILLEMFEIIYTEKAKSKAFRYGIEHKNDLFQYQKYDEYYTKIFKDLMDKGVASLTNLKLVVDDFDEKIESNLSSATKTLELSSNTVDEINQYIKQNGLKGQTFLLQAFERTIIRNQLDVSYLNKLFIQIENLHKK